MRGQGFIVSCHVRRCVVSWLCVVVSASCSLVCRGHHVVVPSRRHGVVLCRSSLVVLMLCFAFVVVHCAPICCRVLVAAIMSCCLSFCVAMVLCCGGFVLRSCPFHRDVLCVKK
jgi:hypothetical protein